MVIRNLLSRLILSNIESLPSPVPSPSLFAMQGQPWRGLAAIAILGSCALANPLAYWNVLGNASLNPERLIARDMIEFD